MSYVRTIIEASIPIEARSDLQLPLHVMKSLDIPSGVSITVCFGVSKAQANVTGVDQASHVIMCPSLVRALHIPTGTKFLMRYDSQQQTLYFGPYLGILLTSYQQGHKQEPFGSLSSFINEVVDTFNQKGGFACIFSIDDVDWENKTVSAFVRQKDLWQNLTLPLPHSIYNRLSSRQREQSEKVVDFVERCKLLKIPFFNERFLNKWQVHKALRNDVAVSTYLPKTTLFSPNGELSTMLQTHRIVYAKPANGSLGKGIFRLIQANGEYGVRFVSKGKVVSLRQKNLYSLQKFLRKRCKGKPYVLQQGLNLIGIDSNPTDFRVLVQKNNRGIWATTSIVARTGQNSIVSNVARGGSIMTAKQALRTCGPWNRNKKPTIPKLKRVALLIAERLEYALQGEFAEFGIDLGIDTNGKVWLLEVNSKPSKCITSLRLRETETVPRQARPSVRHLVNYTAFLHGFTQPICQTPPYRKKNR
ncbi:YheC/YheD family endospore coat-associated protein [Brevibacillus laterosporus]|uniref:YheC/YheD family endospore coat-associated protein n=1 Tax=Brevibacillus laterosporus TaxID=1465 RepID=UPI000B9C3BE9|nr:YheC/YheD family protein [Brevibacillus laterosporus]MBG9786489.1 endospore coat-associated protein [Brevibacillus laterosporus]MCG7318244.1 YheC/YheD family protein [Brevibacillus laterosporus]